MTTDSRLSTRIFAHLAATQERRLPRKHRHRGKEVLAALILLTLLAGCLDSSPTHSATANPAEASVSGAESDRTAPEEEEDTPREPRSSSGSRQQNPAQETNSTGPSNTSGSGPTLETGRQWPPLEEARIRPGATIRGCTTNFVFTSPTNDTLYVGTAAHCVDHLRVGDTIEVYEGEFPEINGDTRGYVATGRLAYSGWWTGNGSDPAAGQDFALIAIDPEHAPVVHPAVQHYGGPTGLFDPASLVHGQRVLWYGNSGLYRQQFDPVKPNEGYACELFGLNPHFLPFVPIGPVFKGDSGSPILTTTGEAMGLLTALSPVSVECGVPSAKGHWLKLGLEEARERGLDVELATWAFLDPGRLPDT